MISVYYTYIRLISLISWYPVYRFPRGYYPLDFSLFSCEYIYKIRPTLYEFNSKCWVYLFIYPVSVYAKDKSFLFLWRVKRFRRVVQAVAKMSMHEATRESRKTPENELQENKCRTYGRSWRTHTWIYSHEFSCPWPLALSSRRPLVWTKALPALLPFSLNQILRPFTDAKLVQIGS